MRNPKYCRNCGKGLVQKQYFDGFNEKTGERSYKPYMACPDAPHYHLYEIESMSYVPCPAEFDR